MGIAPEFDVARSQAMVASASEQGKEVSHVTLGARAPVRGFTRNMTNPAIRMIERGYLRGVLVFETPVRWVQPGGGALAELGARHALAMDAGELDMVELEFPDCPVNDRFFRIGTNPAGMREPIGIDLWRKREG